MAYNERLTHKVTGNTAGVMADIVAGSVIFAGGNNITLSQDGNTVTISGAAAGGAQTAISGIQVSNTTYTSGTVTFQNANGISFGSSGANGVSASYTVPSTAGLISSINVSAGTTSNNLTAFTFNNANGVSFGLDASTITASHNALTSQSNQNVTAGNGGFAFQTLSFSNFNGISFGTSAGSAITASHNALTSQSNQAFSADASSTFQTLTFQDSNGISFSNNAGALRITHALQFTSNTSVITSNALHTTSPRINVSAGTTSNNLSAITFSNSNGITFGLNASTVTASYTRNVVSNALQSVGSATGSGTNTSRFAADDHVHAGVFSMGVSNLGNTVGDTRVDVGRFVLQGGNNITLSQITAANALNTVIVSAAAGGGAGAAVSLPANGDSRTSGGAGYSNITSGTANFFGNNLTLSQDGASITFSANAPGAAAENNWHHALGANTAGNTTASGSTIGFSGINLTISGTNNSVFNLSVPPVSSLVGSSGISISTNGSTITIGKVLQSTYVPNLAFSTNSQTLIVQGATSASARFFPIILSDNIIFNELRVMHNLSYATSSVSGQQTVTYGYGLFSNNAGTLSSISSSSFSLAVTNSSISNTVSYPVSTGTAGYTYTTLGASSTATIQSFWGTAAGGRPIGLQFGNTMSLSSGRYWLGVLLRHSSSSANIGISIAIGGNANALHNSIGYIGVATSAQTTNTAHRVPYMGLGAYTVTQSTLPNAVPLTQIAHTQTVHPLITFIST